MKKTLMIVGFFFINLMTVIGQSESYNPYLIQGVMNPAPLLPAEFNGTGTITFDVGNTGSSDIVHVSGQEMLLTITLSYGVPDNGDPVAAVSGPGAAWFSWEYFSATRTYRATQIATIPGDSRETINIAYRVVENSFYGQSYKNGYNVNISPPGYTNPQPTDDDTVAAYTYVEAKDFGDAPSTYGEAQHMIDLTKDSDGFYNKYMYLGNRVDPDVSYQASTDATGDDSNQTGGLNVDDEDGVIFPALIPGSTVTIPVVLTIVDGDQTGYDGRLSAWIDWNGDGDFVDAGERIVTNMVVDYLVLGEASSGTVYLQVTVPSTATVGQTFARFRFGPSLLLATAPYRSAAYGEVEDYQITIETLRSFGGRVWNDLDGDGTQDSFEMGMAGVRVYVDSNGNGVYNAGEPTAQTLADGSYQIDDLIPGIITARVDTVTLPAEMSQTYDLNGALDHAAVVDLSTAQTRSDVDFGYRSTQSYAIRGQVRDDYNLDGSFSDPDLPVGGVLISLYSDPNGDGTNTDGVVLGTVRTTADGRYAFTNLLSGAYVVVEHDPIGAVSTADAFGHNDNMIAVIIVASDSVDNDFLDAVDPSGYFYDVADGRIVPGGQIVVSGEGADILMDGSNGQYMFVSTNQVETSFTISVTPPSGYMIDPTRPAQPGTFDPTGGPDPTVLGSFENPAQPGYLINYSSASNTYYYVFSLAPGDPLIINNNFPLVKSVTIGSHVWEDLNGNGVQDSGEPGVSNVVVRLLDSSSTLMAVTSTDENGAYLFTNQPPASCRVEFIPPAAYRFTVQHAAGATALTDSDAAPSTGLTPLTVMAGGETNLTVDAGVYIPANLYGYLFEDEDGNLLRNAGDTSITNALVTLTVNGSTVATDHTDQWGYYSFADIPVGAATILVSQVNATLLAVPATNDERRNRAVFSTVESAMIVYPVISGYGVLASLPGEQLNFGFDQYPLSTALSLKVYAASDGKVMIEIATVNENGQSAIEIYAQINGEWVAVAQVPAAQIVGFGDNAYTVEAFGLTAGESYRFRIVDEAGHIFESDLIEVALASVLIEAVTLAPEMIKVAFNTEYGNFYQVMVCGSLGAPWVVEYIQYPTAKGWSVLSNESFMAGPGERTEVLIPRNNRPQAFFKVMKIQ